MVQFMVWIQQSDGCNIILLESLTERSATFPEEAIVTPPVAETKAAADEDDDSDVDLFSEETEEEKNTVEDRAAVVKAFGKKKESGKSLVLMDIKHLSLGMIETDMQKLEEAVRSVQMEGLLWGASKLVPVGYGMVSRSYRSC
ncbi:hypothetical protein M8C21_014665 [Ambrosia artemisiifolia]|uniref:Translation elongation factor EF1B beta/delta subunit guanine nucleotide exchange domain-containing protein n=1 Tax=Ambrosia artemisiifolia TaxID=4212 RepID=A0AAD5DBT3_AMBAR|nr:hypothetical protein M8C21_014665 [Ambrosia artemisiifolia]